MKGRFFQKKIQIRRLLPTVGILGYFIAIFLYSDSADKLYIADGAFIAFSIITLMSVLLGGGMLTAESIKVYLPFAFFSIISIMIAINKSLAFQKAETLFFLIIMIVLINNCVKSGHLDSNTILFCIMIAGLAVAINIITTYSISSVFSGIARGVRIGGDILQLNYLGRYTYYGAVISFYFAYYKKKPLYYFVFAATTIVCVASGSRQAILAFAAGISMLFLIKDYSRKKLFLIVRILVAIAVGFVILNVPILETIRRRVYAGLSVMFTQQSIVSSDIDRMEMIRFGLKTFISNPVFGIGLGNIREVVGGTVINDRSYLHNNFVELLACGGTVGFLTYYYIYYKLFTSIKRKITNVGWCDEIIICLVMIIGQLILDLFAVNYYSKVQYIIFAFAFLALKYSNRETHSTMETGSLKEIEHESQFT